jgi:hypothetical protein
MTFKEICGLRLHNQLISDQRFNSPAEVVRWLGAVQAQDFTGAKWSVGLRLPGALDIDIENAIADKSIIRTWPMRGTLHFVAAEDARWLLKLLTPRIIARSAGRYKQLQLDDHIFGKSQDIVVNALKGNKQLTRGELYSILEEKGIATSDQRGIHILNHLAQNQIICHGSHNEKQPTYTLFDEWVMHSRDLDELESLAEITLRYFTSHGPATINDFVWWTGLKVSDAKKGLSSVTEKLTAVEVEGQTYWYSTTLPDLNTKSNCFLLPGFDEYMLGYTDRSLILDQKHWAKIVPGNNGMFMPTIIIDGKVEGTWKRSFKKGMLQMDMYPFGKLSDSRKKRIEVQAETFATYLSSKIAAVNWLG